MNACSTCNCSPCQCAQPTVLNQARLISPIVSGGTFTGGTFAGPTINGGTLTGSNIVGATIDCTTLGCTQPPGTNDATLATTAFVVAEVSNLISALNPAFCDAVQTCIAGTPSTCALVVNCINTTPGSINNIIAFDPSVFASTLQVGVTRFATLAELQGVSCLLAIDPCNLEAFWNAGGPNALWTAFEGAVGAVLAASPTFCAQVFACGAAPVASPTFTGVPAAPTAAPGTNTTQLATTAFVNTAVNGALAAAISAGNPAFCAAVTACAASTVVFATFAVTAFNTGANLTTTIAVRNILQVGCVGTPVDVYTPPAAGTPGGTIIVCESGDTTFVGGMGRIDVVFSVAQVDTDYEIVCNLATDATVTQVGGTGDTGGAGMVVYAVQKTVNGFTIQMPTNGIAQTPTDGYRAIFKCIR